MLGRQFGGMKSSSTSSLPLYGFETTLDDSSGKYFKPSKFLGHGSIWRYLEYHIREIAASKETRKVLYFLLLNISFTGVEFVYGYITNSLGLTADAVHMLFDSSAIILSLAASVIAKWDVTETYTLGFSRVETLAGFVNALALFFASGNIVWEAIERLFHPEELLSDKLLVVSFLGFLVNLVGIFAFDHGGAHGHSGHSHSHHDHHGPIHAGHGHHQNASHSHGHSHDGHDHYGHGHENHDHYGHDHSYHDHAHSHGHHHSHSNHTGHSHSHSGQSHLMHGMFLHVLADTLGSVGVIISTLSVRYFGWTWADPLCSIFIAVLITASSWPLLKETGEILLQRSPRNLDLVLPSAIREVKSIEGVVSCTLPRVYQISHGQFIGSIRVQASSKSPEYIIRQRVAQHFYQIGINDMTIQVEQDQSQTI